MNVTNTEDEMTILQIEHEISDFETWKAAFDRDPLERKASGVRSYRVLRPLDDPRYIKVDLEFDSSGDAESFLGKLEGMWQSGAAAPALRGSPRVQLVEEAGAEDLR
jgi:hypothetical protein